MSAALLFVGCAHALWVWLRSLTCTEGPVSGRGGGSLVPRPHPQEEERVWYLTSEFLVVLSQHVRKTGNPIRLLDLLQLCDMKEN